MPLPKPQALLPAACLLELLLLNGCSKPASQSQPTVGSASAAPLVATPPVPVATASAAAAEPVMLSHLCPAWGKHGFLPRGVGVPVGQVVPDVSGLGADGKPVRLRDLAPGQGPLVLIFYRGAFDAFGAYQLRALSVQAQALRDSGARFLFISNDTPAQMAQTMSIHGLTWPTLADPDRAITRAFQLEGRFDDKDVAVAAREKLKLPLDAKGELVRYTNPAVLVVDQAGKVKWAHADARLDMMLSYSQILDGITQAGFGARAPTN